METKEIFSLEEEWRNCKRKFDSLFLTRNLKENESITRKEYTLKKIWEGLFRLEGSNFGVLLSSQSHLFAKEGKTQGLVLVSDSAINKTILHEHKNLESFLASLGKITNETESVSVFLGEGVRKTFLESIQNWNPFYRESLFVSVKPNTLAIVFCSGEESIFREFQKNSSKRLQEILRKELYYLSLKNHKDLEDWSPSQKIRSFWDSDLCLHEFYQLVNEMEKKRERENP